MSITLAGQSLPDPNRYNVEVSYRGGSQIMADGTPVFDLVSGTDKAKIIIGWAALTGAQKSTLETAWGTLKNTSATLVDYDTTNYTVSAWLGITQNKGDILSFHFVSFAKISG